MTNKIINFLKENWIGGVIGAIIGYLFPRIMEPFYSIAFSLVYIIRMFDQIRDSLGLLYYGNLIDVSLMILMWSIGGVLIQSLIRKWMKR